MEFGFDDAIVACGLATRHRANQSASRAKNSPWWPPAGSPGAWCGSAGGNEQELGSVWSGPGRSTSLLGVRCLFLADLLRDGLASLGVEMRTLIGPKYAVR